MALITFGDFRESTLADYCAGLALTTAEAPDAVLTSAIARVSAGVDDYCSDHFETQAGVSLTLFGSGTPYQPLPRRCTAVTSVKTVDRAGTQTTQASTAYRLVSSLDSTGALEIRQEDFIVVTPGQFLSNVLDYRTWDFGLSPYGPNDGRAWPYGAGVIIVTGNFGWTTAPADVKRAVALITFGQFKPLDEALGRASPVSQAGQAYSRAPLVPSGIPEADEILNRRQREHGALVG